MIWRVTGRRSAHGRCAAGGAAAVAISLLLAFAAPAPAEVVFETKWGSPGSGDGQFIHARMIALDQSGDVFVTDRDAHRVQIFDSEGNFIRKWGVYGEGDGQLRAPYGIAVDALDNVFIDEHTTRRVQVFDSEGNFIRNWGSPGGGDGQFQEPNDLAVDSSSNVFVADTYNSPYRIQVFDSEGNFIRKWGSSGSGDGQLDHPNSVFVDESGNVFVSDSQNDRIQVFDSEGHFIRKWGTTGSGDGQFSAPSGVTVDALGNVFVTDAGANDRIQEFDSEGNFIRKWGSTGSGDGQFDTPLGVVAEGGDVFVVDNANDRVEKFAIVPVTSLDSTPSALTSDSTADFSFSSDEPGATFECMLDGEGWSACSSPYETPGLEDGSHEFWVRGVYGENPDPTPESFEFTVDTTPPVAPTISATDPASPSNANEPKVQGVVGGGDSDLDLAVANYTPNTVSVLMGSGKGVFASPQAFSSGGGLPSAVAVGDFNGDDDPDLAVTNTSSNTISIFLGSAEGAFTGPNTFGSGGTAPQSIAVGDFNGDEDPDLAVAHTNSNNISIFLGSTGGTFTGPTGYSSGGSIPRSIAVGDFNGDEDPDLAVTNNGSSNVAIFLGSTGGTFIGPGPTSSGGSAPYSVAVDDFNGDEDPDLAVTNYGSSSVAIRLGASGSSFEAPTPYSSGGYLLQALAVDDFNGDEDPDLAVTNMSNNTISIFLGSTGGTFSGPTSTFSSEGTSPQSIAVGDFNGDEDPDLVVANSASNNLVIRLGSTGGSFGSPTVFDGNPYPRSIAVGNFNAAFNADVTEVEVYVDDASCSGTPAATGSREAFEEGGGITVSVPDDHTAMLRARAVDGVGHVSPCSSAFEYVEDSTSPDTTIDSGPHGTTTDDTPAFEFSSDEEGSSFECRIDSGSWASCSNPHTSATLAEGRHLFQVRATDKAGNVDASPALEPFSVATTPGSIVGWGLDNDGQATPPAGTDFVAIAGGQRHSLALKSDGSIVGWGEDDHGQATPPAGTNYVAVAAATAYSLALKADGSLAGWGYGFFGQNNPPAGTDYAEVAAGGAFGLALKSNGSIVGWGFNGYGQTSPPAGTNYTAIAAGGAHSLALKSDGSIAGWGYDENGQASPPSGNDYTAIAAGGFHSLALSTDTTAPTDPTLGSPSHETGVVSNDATVEITWSGASDPGSGVDGFSYAWSESASTLPDTTKDAEEGASGTTSGSLAEGSWYFHLRTRDNAGNWTSTAHIGPFVIDTTAPSAPTITETEPASPSSDNEPKVKGSGEASSTVRIYSTADCSGTALATGSAAAFGSTGLTVSVPSDATTTLRASAEDEAGNTSACSSGFDYTEDSTSPDTTIDSGPHGTTTDDTPAFEFSSSEEGSSFECRIDSGAWGSCSSAHTTAALDEGSHLFQVRATDAADNTDASPAVEPFTVVASPGSIVGWGRDDDGQASPPAGNDYVAITAGDLHSLALKEDGSMVGWGHNSYSTDTPPAGNDYVAITTGLWHSLALKEDGSMVGWGYDAFGQASPPSGNDYVAIAAGGVHSLALKSDGSIVGWGFNGENRATPPAGNDYVAIAGGGEHSLALKEDGSIVGWGRDDFNQATPPGGSDYVAIAAGAHYSLALKEDGSIVGWGDNTFGQATPPAGNDYVAMAGGGYHSLALKEDGSLVGWGRDDDGQASPPSGDEYVAIAGGGFHTLALSTDTTPPTDPTLGSPSHTVSVPSNDTTVEITWSGASDPGSGVDGFSYAWSQSASTLPDASKDAEESATGTTSNSLAEGSWYFHLRTRDNAGNWTSTAHLGPFVIDTTAPSAPTITETEPASPSSDNEPKVKGSGEASSTVRIYSTADCSGTALATGSAAAFGSTGLTVSVPSDTTTTLRATAEDEAGNTSPCSSGFPYTEDSTAPQTTLDKTPPSPDNDPTPSFEFSADEAATFECEIDDGGFSTCTSPHTTATLSDGTHTFKVRATDGVGNTDATPATHTWQIDTTVPAPPSSPASQPPTSPSQPSAEEPALGGIAVAAGVAQVKSGSALVRLFCRGSASCKGVVQLVVRVKEKRQVKRNGRRRVAKRTRNLVIGKSPFTIPAGNGVTVRVKLTGKGKKLLGQAGKRGLNVKLLGRGVKPRALRLKEARSKKPKRKRQSAS